MSKKLCSAAIATAFAAGLVALSIFGCWQDCQSNKSQMLDWQSCQRAVYSVWLAQGYV